jgi:hypothetical protein
MRAATIEQRLADVLIYGMWSRLQGFRRAWRLAVLERGIEQLPARNEVLQHALETRDVERAGPAPHDRAIFEARDGVLVGLGAAKILALVAALIIVVVEVDAGYRVVVLLQEALPNHLFDRAEGCDRRRIRQALDRADAMLLQNALHAADGVALAVQQAPDPSEQIDIVGAVVAAAAAALHRLDLGEPRLPKPQYVLGNIEIVSDLADGSERIRRLVQMPSSSCRPLALVEN